MQNMRAAVETPSHLQEVCWRAGRRHHCLLLCLYRAVLNEGSILVRLQDILNPLAPEFSFKF